MKESWLKDMSENNFLLRRQLWNAIISFFFVKLRLRPLRIIAKKQSAAPGRPFCLPRHSDCVCLPYRLLFQSSLSLLRHVFAPPPWQTAPLSPLFVRSVGGRWLEKQTGTNTCCLKRLETNIRVREWRRPIGGGWNSGKHLSIRNECNGCDEIAFGKWKVLSHQLADIN